MRLQIQNRQRQRRNHKQDSRDGRSFAQECAGAASAERCLTAAATEGSCPIRAGALLQQHDDDQKNANQNMNNRQKNNHLLSVLNDGRERGRIQACASDQCTIDMSFFH